MQIFHFSGCKAHYNNKSIFYVRYYTNNRKYAKILSRLLCKNKTEAFNLIKNAMPYAHIISITSTNDNSND